MIAEVHSDGRRDECFSGCRGADELVQIFNPILIRVVECFHLFSMTKVDIFFNVES